jgi:hypothetical protein
MLTRLSPPAIQTCRARQRSMSGALMILVGESGEDLLGVAPMAGARLSTGWQLCHPSGPRPRTHLCASGRSWACNNGHRYPPLLLLIGKDSPRKDRGDWVPAQTSENSVREKFGTAPVRRALIAGYRTGAMQDRARELPRMVLPRRWLNRLKGAHNKEGRGAEQSPGLLLLAPSLEKIPKT